MLVPSPQVHGMPLPIYPRLWPPSPDEIGAQAMPIPIPSLVSFAAPSYLKLCLLDDVLIPPSREQITAPARLPHLRPSAPPLSPGPTPVYANHPPKHGASRHTRQSPHPRRELAAGIPTASFYLRVCRHRPLPSPAAAASSGSFTRPPPHDVAKCCQCPPNTTTPCPPGSCPPASTQFDDISRQAQEGCDNIRKTVLAQPPVL